MNRRELVKLGAGVVASGLAGAADAKAPTNQYGKSVEQWDVFETRVQGPSSGNPFVDVSFGGIFTLGNRRVIVPGFYDGDGIYCVRFSPDATGTWSYVTTGNVKELRGHTGSLTCVPAKAGNRGPVGTAHQFHFEYADGTPYFPFGTTCYAYGFLGDPYEQQTLDELKIAGFNKVRMCVLPKPLGQRKPTAMPFEHAGTVLPAGAEDLTDDSKSKETFNLVRLNPVYFRHIEQRIRDLGALGIEADLILFHPYDAWGFKAMPEEADDRYLRYVVARFSAYRNVWWSIANEFDLLKAKTMKDWDRFFRIVQENDPYSRLRSIHHSKVIYDHSKAWCTHASLQEYDFDKSPARLAAWNKPIIYDEIQYEGNIARRWGNLSPMETTYRFWRAIVAGTYATHGETYMVPDGEPVWSDGGKLRGTSAARILFLKKLLERTKTPGLIAPDAPYYTYAANAGEVYLYYFDSHCVGEYEFPLPEKDKFTISMIDPWEMSVLPLPGTFNGTSKVTLSGKPYMAVLIQKA